MKQLTIILAATMIFLTLGCEKRVGQAEDADRFDEKIDGPVCVLTVIADENLLADQKKISRQAKLDAESIETEEKTDGEDTTASPTPVPDVSDTPVAKPVAKPAAKPAVVPRRRPDERRRFDDSRRPDERRRRRN